MFGSFGGVPAWITWLLFSVASDTLPACAVETPKTSASRAGAAAHPNEERRRRDENGVKRVCIRRLYRSASQSGRLYHRRRRIRSRLGILLASSARMSGGSALSR